MSKQEMDYTAYAQPTPSDLLGQLASLANDQANLENELLQMERAAEAKKEELRRLTENTIPELMDQLDMEEFTTKGGLRIKIAEVIRASIPKARSDEAVKWLDDHGFANLVKRKFTVMFGKEEETWARKFAADLRRRKHQLNVDEEASVHSRTLAAFVKEQLEAGEDMPVDLFGVFRQRVSKIEYRK